MKTMTYLDFLCDIVWELTPDTAEKQRERLLMKQLYDMEFYSLIPNDDNRGMDGLQIRDTFIDNGGGQQALPLSPCSVLEMLIGLSFRLEFETSQSKWEKTPKEWFWILMDNLDIHYRYNQDLSLDEYSDKIVTKVSHFIERHYKSSGEGGLFPLKHAIKDQKKVEIWYQMSAFILENYPI